MSETKVSSGMRVGATERELLTQEIGTLAGMLRDPAARARYGELRDAVQDGEVPEALLGHLGNILELGLQSGRLRALYGADGEQALTKLFHRTPTGAALQDEARSVTHALSGLQTQRIEDIRVSALGPGTYGLTIDTDRCQVSVRLDRSGVRVESLAIGI
jgi:hypothetical protein